MLRALLRGRKGGNEFALLAELMRAAGVQLEAGELVHEDRKAAFQRLAGAAAKRETEVQLIRFRGRDGAHGECLIVMSQAPGAAEAKKKLDTPATPGILFCQLN